MSTFENRVARLEMLIEAQGQTIAAQQEALAVVQDGLSSSLRALQQIPQLCSDAKSATLFIGCALAELSMRTAGTQVDDLDELLSRVLDVGEGVVADNGDGSGKALLITIDAVRAVSEAYSATHKPS